MRYEEQNYVRIILWTAAVITALSVGGCFVYPQFTVYEQKLAGEAELQRAESSRRIAVLEAQAKLDSSKSLAQAEVERAKGVAEANKIIGESLAGNEAYLRYLWINELKDSDTDVIYVPTEASLPILEASRFKQP